MRRHEVVSTRHPRPWSESAAAESTSRRPPEWRKHQEVTSMNDEQRAELGQQIREARRARGWSQARLGENAGVAENTVLSIEKGNPAQSAKVRAVLDALDLVPPATVIALDGVTEDIRIFLTVALQRLRVLDEPDRARVLADLYPRLLTLEAATTTESAPVLGVDLR